MGSNINYVIMVITDWRRLACIAYMYFVTSNHTFFDENYLTSECL